MQIPIASSVYYTTVVIRRPEFWGPNLYCPFFKYKQCFDENIIKMIPTTRIMMQQWVSHTALTLTVFVKKYTPCQGVVWSQYRLSGTFYVPLAFNVVLFAKVCFFIPMQFWKAVDFTLALWYPNFKLQYLMNYSSDFNNFCRFQLLAVCTTLL